MFLGRERELQELNNLYGQAKFQMFILYGRRRVGKTTLLKEFCKDKPAIFYAAEQSNEKLNLEKFSATVFHHFGEKNMAPFISWEMAFDYIVARQKDEQLILVLDEFPYLADINPGLLSILQHLIDHKLQNSKLFIILCGSYVSFMENEVLGAKSPLFGRRTSQLRLLPFNYQQSAAFLRKFAQVDKLILYSIYGGTALYLSKIDAHQDVAGNVEAAFLNPMGYLYEEPLLLLKQEVQEPGVYFALLEAIAGGAVRVHEIAAKTGEPAAKCIKYMEVLHGLGLLEKEKPYGEKESSRRTQYKLSDPMCSFWYRYVAPNKTLLETGAASLVWHRLIEPDLPDYLGHMFERICHEYLLWKNSLGKLPFLFRNIGRWWGTDPLQHKEIEIDIVAGNGKEYLFGECKWHKEKVGLEVLSSLQERAKTFLGKRTCKSYYVLFSKSGFTKGLLDLAKQDKHVLLVTPEQMF
jgi:AAA+ ATPase superfamily predicted ATPase